MQDQLDMMILERVSDGHFDISIPYSEHSKDIEREYRSRGFLVRSNNEATDIFWRNPDLDKMVKPNTKIFSLFTAQQLYYVLTTGKDLRRLTNVIVYQELIRENRIEQTYGMEKTAVYNLFNQAINKAIDEGFTVVVNDYGVITSNKNKDFDVREHRSVDKTN